MRELVLASLVALLVVVAGCVGGGGADSASMGYAAGGAQDVNDFRNNVEEGYVPQPASMTVEGLYHDYYFDTGREGSCDATFCPSYSRAVAEDPLSGEREQYMTVGLNSGISADEFERKKLNLVVVVDTSGSMDSEFSSYHYDGEDGGEERAEARRKIAAARDAVSTLTTHLGDDDRLGVVAYDDDARTVVDMQRVGEADMDAVREQIQGMEAGGGTNLDAGMATARTMLEPYENPNATERETRVVYVTDAMPNLGQTDGGGLGERLDAYAADGVHSTFIGVGVDFNAEFVETVNDVRGANHYVVESADEFAERMDEGFDYMVTPMVYDLTVEVESAAYDVEAVYGSPNANATDGELVQVNTLFPSRTEGNRTEGGVILVELNRTAAATGRDAVTLRASYETRDGERRRTERTVAFADREAPYYESTGVRKAVALARYADLIRNWMAHERARAGEGSTTEVPAGIERRELGEWEQTSVDLRVSEPYGERVREFRGYFASEAAALGDEDLQQELAVMDTLLNGTDAGDGPASDAGESANGTTADATAANGAPTANAARVDATSSLRERAAAG